MEKFVLSSAMTQKPVFNHTNKTITVTDKFMKEAAKPFTNEFNDLMMLCERCPGYKVITRSHRRPSTSKKTPNIPKFVSYDHMERYIKLLPDGANLLAQLQLVKDYAKAHTYAASIVFKWFNETFPDYRKDPKIDTNGNLIATVNIVSFEDFKKKAEAEPQDTDELKKVI